MPLKSWRRVCPLPYAHSPNHNDVPHDLVEHLTSVAQQASQFAEKFGAADMAYWAGLWHDLGKFHPDFQAYLANPIARRGPDHSSAGAILAERSFSPLAFLVAGHHGGLPALKELKLRVREKAKASAISQALDLAQQAISGIEPTGSLEAKLPAFLQETPQKIPEQEDFKRRLELFLRMVFSALVDADFLDTESHFEPEQAAQRGQGVGLGELWRRFERAQVTLSGRKQGQLNEIRHEIYQACLRTADNPPGMFSLTVPTGGGKTRSGMAFALQHALVHSLDRVIVAIPYTSIIEQTADVYRAIFGTESVLEHHSAVSAPDDPSDPLSYQDVWPRLASQNWDAPIVVTTTVQLFESLFANRPSACRKLHNIARSVVILDEVQTLPPELLAPILDVLQDLVDHYQVSVMLCTATQPALQDGPYLKGMREVREIIVDPGRYFVALKRVCYELPTHEERWTWERVATEMRSVDQGLAIVNTKQDALRLLDALNDPAAFHLSTLLCGAHRRDVLQEIRRRLETGETCRLVSTQVVEAGVDLDFPLVLRALGPLDRIVQAAGRCNREGRHTEGRVVIFVPEEGAIPRGAYDTGTATALSLLNLPGADLHDPLLYRTYFERLYQAIDLDKKRIQDLREELDYPEVAHRFRLIEDDTAPIVVRPDGYRHEVDNLLSSLGHVGEPPRWLLRRLQPYIVGARTRLIPDYHREGLLNEVAPGVWEWLGQYDAVRGLTVANRDPADLVV
jgi:CRISPR-associated endonuclease/helicase Cas3